MLFNRGQQQYGSYVQPVVHPEPIALYEQVISISVGAARKAKPDHLSIRTGQYYMPVNFDDGRVRMTHIESDQINWGNPYYIGGYYLQGKNDTWTVAMFDGLPVWDNHYNGYMLDKSRQMLERDLKYTRRVITMLNKSEEYLNNLVTPDQMVIAAPEIEIREVPVDRIPWKTTLAIGCTAASISAIILVQIFGGLFNV